MEAVGQLVDALYTRLVLRDFFGRVLPGIVVLWAFAPFLELSYPAATLLGTLNLGQWLLLIAAAWVTAFVVQRLGELRFPIVGRIVFYSPPFNVKELATAEPDDAAWGTLAANPLWWYQLVIAFRTATAHAEEAEHRLQLERAVVIKEACGNNCVALGLATTVAVFLHALGSKGAALISAALIGEWVSDALQHAPIAIAVLGTLVLLRRLHLEHVWRQYVYARSVLEARNVDVTRYPAGRPPYPSWRRFAGAVLVFWLAAVVAGLVWRVVVGLI